MYLLKIQFFPHLTLNIFCLYNIMGCNIRALERNQISVKNEKEKLNLWEQICSLREDTFCSEEVSGVEFNCFLTMKNVQVYVYGMLIKGSVHFHLPVFTSLSYLPVFTSLACSFVFNNWYVGDLWLSSALSTVRGWFFFHRFQKETNILYWNSYFECTPRNKQGRERFWLVWKRFCRPVVFMFLMLTHEVKAQWSSC